MTMGKVIPAEIEERNRDFIIVRRTIDALLQHKAGRKVLFSLRTTGDKILLFMGPLSAYRLGIQTKTEADNLGHILIKMVQHLRLEEPKDQDFAAVRHHVMSLLRKKIKKPTLLLLTKIGNKCILAISHAADGVRIPLVIEEDTLWSIYARVGQYLSPDADLQPALA